MKSKFSKTWNASKQPRKQRKFRANAPNHIKKTFMGATLDKPLRIKHKRRSIEVRKGDEVKVMRGKFKGKLGKVGSVNVKNTRIQIDGIQRAKAGGGKLVTWFNPSNVKIVSLNLEDNKRMKSLPKKEKEEEKENKKTTVATEKVSEKEKPVVKKEK